jgi:aryl-alcohol dehydrogenase-like predicted oxidoreductase
MYGSFAGNKVIGKIMIPQRSLGKQGLKVGAIGYGAMVLEGWYGAIDESAAVDTIRHALDIGVNLIDTADAYGNKDCIIATKFGIVFEPGIAGTEWPTNFGFSLYINGKPDYVRKCLDNSLRRLGVETIDLWYLHWPDRAMPIEETVGAMAEGVKAGKVRYLGLSNVTADEARRAHKIHPISAVQYEYSLWRRELETSLLPALRELGIGLVPWAPLGSGFLSGKVSELSKDDWRNKNPRYVGDNLKANKQRFAPLLSLAKELGITPAQLALAWLLHQGDNVVPIPGSRNPERVSENAAAASVRLSADVLKRVDQIAPAGSAAGKTLM